MRAESTLPSFGMSYLLCVVLLLSIRLCLKLRSHFLVSGYVPLDKSHKCKYNGLLCLMVGPAGWASIARTFRSSTTLDACGVRCAIEGPTEGKLLATDDRARSVVTVHNLWETRTRVCSLLLSTATRTSLVCHQVIHEWDNA